MKFFNFFRFLKLQLQIIRNIFGPVNAKRGLVPIAYEPPMYICLCNRLRSADLESAVDNGARTADDVFRALNVEPQCCGCLDFAENEVAQVIASRYQKAS